MDRKTLTTYLALARTGIPISSKQAEEIVSYFNSANTQLLKANEQNEKLLTYLEDAHEHIGHLSAHLAGRIAVGARFEMAKRADEWRVYCEQLREEQDQ